MKFSIFQVFARSLEGSNGLIAQHIRSASVGPVSATCFSVLKMQSRNLVIVSSTGEDRVRDEELVKGDEL